MKITEVRVKIMDDRSDKLQAFCTITIDDAFVIRDLKIIEGAKGIFVAMPSRKLTDRCPKCGGKNHLRAAYCNDCGLRLTGDRAARDDQGRAKLHADIAHPINSATREVVSRMVIDAYRGEAERSKLPGYVPQKLYDGDEYDDFDEHGMPTRTPPAGTPVVAPPAARHAQPPVPPNPRPPEAKRPASPPQPQPQPQPVAAQAPVSAAAKTDDDFAKGIFA